MSLLLISSLAVTEPRSEIVNEIHVQAIEAGIDPDYAVAIATVESSLNPKAIGQLGEIGLFQLRPEFHDVRAGNHKHNIQVAISYLKEIKERWEPQVGNAWFVFFNCGPYNPPRLFSEYPRHTRYYKKVMHELNRIKTKRYLAVYH